MMMPWGSAFAINNLKVTNEQLPILFMVAGIATLLIMPIIGKMSDKLNKMTIFTFASIFFLFRSEGACVGIFDNFMDIQILCFMLFILLPNALIIFTSIHSGHESSSSS